MTRYYELQQDTPTAKAGAVYEDMGNERLGLPGSGEDEPIFYIPDIKDFDAWFKEVNNPSEPNHSLGWEPKIGEKYYVNRGAYITPQTNEGVGFDKTAIKKGRTSKTKRELIEKANVDEAKHTIWKYMREHGMFFEPDWSDDDHSKYVIDGWAYDDDCPTVDTKWCRDTSQHSLVFASREDRQQILDKFPDELKLILKRW